MPRSTPDGTGIIAILAEAHALLADPKRVYQTRLIAALDTGKLEEYRDHKRNLRRRPKWDVCSPKHPQAMLSLRGAINAASPSAPAAWRVYEVMARQGFGLHSEPATKQDALLLLSDCIRLLQRQSGMTAEEHAAQQAAKYGAATKPAMAEL